MLESEIVFIVPFHNFKDSYNEHIFFINKHKMLYFNKIFIKYIYYSYFIFINRSKYVKYAKKCEPKRQESESKLET